MSAGRGARVQGSFARSLEAMLSRDEASDGLWRTLRRFVAEHTVEAFRRAQENGVHLLPVNYHSPVPDTRELDELDFRERADFLALCHVDAAGQLSFLESIARWAAETDGLPGVQPSPDDFHWNNSFFGNLDALTYYCIVRELKPRRIVEIGCGYSTMLAARAAVLNGHTELLCVDPLPAKGLTGLRGVKRVLAVPAQRLPREFFDELGDGDILFVDSSHVSKIGSDVNFLVLDVLPRLRDGVLVHFHDVFLPYEYPRAWVDGLAFLNEQYLLAAFLLFNERFELLALNQYLSRVHRDGLEKAFARTFPPQPLVEPSSLWLRRRPEAG